MLREADKRLLVISLVVAFTLTVLPHPSSDIKPYWVALVVIYWMLESPFFRQLSWLFALGLLLDLLSGSLFGQHALSLLIMAYLLLRFRQRLRFFHAWQLTGAVFLLLLNDRILQLWVLWLSGQPPSLEYWFSPLTGAVAWPWIFLGLDALRSRSRRLRSREEQT